MRMTSCERKIVDSLKGIAILSIVLVHYGLASSNIWVNRIVSAGARGVQLMFVINGYLIFKSLERAHENGMGLKQWYKGKIIRIIPMYWLFTILDLIIFGTGNRFYLGPLPKVSWLNLICNMLCIHGFFPYYINSININWFIADLAIWYVIAPIAYRVFNSLKKTLIGLVILVPIIYIFLGIAGGMSPIAHEGIWNDYISIMCFPAEFPVILLGVLIYWLMKTPNMKCLSSKESLPFMFLAFVGIIYLMSGSNKIYIFTDIFTFGFFFMMVVWIQLTNPMPLLSNGIFAVFGRHSYVIYLSQWFWIKAFKYICNVFDIQMPLFICRFGGYCLVCIFTLGGAIILDSLYQKLLSVFRKNA